MEQGQAPYVLLIVTIPVPTTNPVADQDLALFAADCASIVANDGRARALGPNAWLLPVGTSLRSLHAIADLCRKLKYPYTTHLIREELTPITY